MRKYFRNLVSLLLIASVMAGLSAPFDLTVFAQEEAATGSDIYAMIYKIDPNKNNTRNLELVFQRGDAVDPDRVLVKKCENFADSDGSTNPPWYDGYASNRNIVAVDVKDRIAPTNMARWFTLFTYMTDENFKNIDKIDTSNCTSFRGMFNYACYLEHLDLTCWDVSNVTTVLQMFTHLDDRGANYGLKSLNVSNWVLPKCTDFSQFIMGSRIENLDLSSFNCSNVNNMANMLSSNTQLKTVKLGNINGGTRESNLGYIFTNDINLESVYSSGEPIPGHADLSSISNTTVFSFAHLFENCAKIESIDFGDNLMSKPGTRDYAYDGAFAGCESLKKVDLKCCPGGLRAQVSIFKGCSNLEEINFSTLENKKPDKGYESNFNIKNVPINIYEDCSELKEVTFNEKYPKSDKAGNSVPPKSTWARIKNADGSKFTGKEVLPASQLFLNFQQSYAGTWVAVDKIVLDANGGKPQFQSIDGAKGMEAVYDDSATASRTGYAFDGWWSDKTGGSKLENGAELESWTYYAHWIENQYSLVLHGNGGKVPDGLQIDGAVISEDRESITFSNINYTQFVDLSSRMFENEDGSVLASWNIRKNGTSTQFAANDAVNKLAINQGDTADLYAQWHTPSAVITFDSQGGSAVEKRDYEIGDRYGTLSTPVKDRDAESPAGYTFVGWFTQPDGKGYEIVDKADEELDNTIEQNKVTETRTLYAYWMSSCAVTFGANGGTIDGESESGKVVMYNQKVGKLPVPEKGSAAFDGWYGDEGRISSDTVITDKSITFTARWGYQPVFETDGGSFAPGTVLDYELIDDPDYSIEALPEVDKYRCAFLGWYADEDNDGVFERKVTEHSRVDLSQSAVIKAKWKEDVKYTVTLNADGGVIAAGESEYSFYKDDVISGLPVPVKTGYEFGGWYSGDTEIIENVTAVTSDLTLKAKWIEKDCTVTFNPNGGALYDPSDAAIKVVGGKTLPAIPGANKKEADGSVQYFFGGWYPNADGTGERLEPDTVIDANRTYYAKWIDPKNYVLIDDNGTTDMSNQLYMYSVTWGSPSDGNVTNDTGDNLSFHPISSGNISALLRIQFYSYDNNTSTDITLPPGSVKIKIPKYIFKDREGNNIGTDNLSVGLPDHPVTDSDRVHFYYEEVEENGEKFYVITNSVEMTGRHDDFEIFYQADPNKIAGGYIDENGYYRYMGDDTEDTSDDRKNYTNQFDVKINVDIDGDGDYTGDKELDFTQELTLDVHTRVNTEVRKIQTDVSMRWNTEWGAEPDDSAEYYFVTWNLVSYHSSSTQPFAISWSEDTVRDGAIVVPPSNEPNKFRNNGTYLTTVVTKHLKNTVYKTENGWANAHNEAELEVEWKSGYKQRFRASADAYAYIEDESASGGGSTTFTKRINGSPEVNDEHYIQGGQEKTLVNEEIPLVYVISYKETKRDVAPTWNARTGTYTTPERTMTIEDGAAGDLVLSQYSKNPLPYESDWNASRDTNLNESDYYFDKLDISITEFDAIKMNDIWSNPFAHENVSDYSDSGITVSIRRVGKNEIETLKPLIHTAAATVDLPDDTVWFRVSYSSAFYTTDISVKPTVVLKPTNHIKSMVQDHIEAGKDTIIKNRCRLSFKEGNSQAVVTETGPQGTSGWYSAYVLNIGESKLYASKSCCSQGNVIRDNDTASESLPAVISGWGYNTTGNKKPMTSAAFYDLLPEGYTVDRSTVFVKPRSENTVSGGVSADNYYSVKNGGGLLASAYYSVSFEDNWNNCGRTLMTVEVNIPDGTIATGVDVYYMMNTSYANVISNGATPNNIFAYKDTTPGQSIPVERSKSISEIEAKFRPSLAFADSNQTAFNSANLNAISPSNISSGISSTVRTEGAAVSNHQIIGRNTDYSYSISYTSDANYAGENLVLYDLIEKQVGKDISEWRGEFKSIDVSGIKTVKNKNDNSYCEPVVYYSTKESFTEDDLDITKEDVWTTAMPAKESITAVAVDCRKSSGGSNFVLDVKKGLSFDVNMHSPSDTDNNIKAYNEGYVTGNLVNVSLPVDNVTQTSVTIRFTVPQFVKDAFPASGTVDQPESVVKNSVLEYVLRITNPDDEVPMENVTVEDIL